jgi:hypothetical protein
LSVDGPGSSTTAGNEVTLRMTRANARLFGGLGSGHCGRGRGRSSRRRRCCRQGCGHHCRHGWNRLRLHGYGHRNSGGRGLCARTCRSRCTGHLYGSACGFATRLHCGGGCSRCGAMRRASRVNRRACCLAGHRHGGAHHRAGHRDGRARGRGRNVDDGTAAEREPSHGQSRNRKQSLRYEDALLLSHSLYCLANIAYARHEYNHAR